MSAGQRRMREPGPRRPSGEGCSAGDLAYWFKDSVLHPKPPKVPPKPKPPMTLAQLPAACKQVLLAPDGMPDPACAWRPGC